MFKRAKWILLYALLFICAAVQAAILGKDFSGNKTKITATTFSDFFPFGYTVPVGEYNKALGSVFENVLQKFFEGDTYTLEYKLYDDLKEAATSVRLGQTDIFIGAYYASKTFDGIDYVFPAAFENPVHILMSAQSTNTIKSMADLENLKGIYNKQEHFSDFVMQNFERMHLSGVENADEAYRMLLTGEADYMLGSYYYNYVKTVEMGLKSDLVFSANALWNMPMFFAVSQMCDKKDSLVAHLTRAVTNPEFSETLVRDIKETIKNFEIQHQGIVAPAYIRKGHDNELTPADEKIKGSNL